MTLAELKKGQSATVTIDLSDKTLARLIDMGLFEKEHITCLFRSVGGEITAYKIGDCTVALRKENAKKITVYI